MNSIETAVGSGMRLTCSRDELAQALAVVSRGVSTRGAVQILGGILLRAEAGSLQLAATDMEISLRTTLEAEIGEDGAVVVPGRLLVDIVRLLPEADVSLEHKLEEHTLRVTCGAAEYRLRTYGVEDFPRLPDVDRGLLNAIESEPLLETIGRVSRAASRDESRPVLTGILVRFEPGKLVMAATDSYRLSVKETPLESNLPELEAIVPARALDELRRIAAGTDTVELGVHENQIVFGVGDVWLTSRRIDGQFPNYKTLIPDAFEHEVTLSREELLEVVRRTGVMAQRNAPLRLRFAEGELTISAQTQDVGESRESLPAPFAGEPLEIGFNPEFLRDGIDSVTGDSVTLRLINPLRPGLIEGAAGDFWYLIMPIRLAG
jgi:DNA polymerase III subunit beta